MALKVYNTLTRQKEEFNSREPGKVGMYVCGPTVYNYIHIGNARCYLAFDVIKRYLKFKGYEIFHVQNYTDIDDKIIARAREKNLSTKEIAQRYTEAFEEDMKALGVLPVDKHPRATEHLADMIDMIKGLVDKGHAYVVDGNVFFSITSFDDYGKLSHRNLEDMRAGERVDVDVRKRHPMDFALWKKAKPGEPHYPSPWGEGRPGWHIECSAMSLKYLGMSFDIHGGGQDLIFPHHENEIAQAESYTGSEPFVRHWLHNGFVNIEKEKMAKSVGNIVLVRDVLKQYEPVALRILFLSTHWRSPINFSEDNLIEAQEKYNRLKDVLINIDHELQTQSEDPGNSNLETRKLTPSAAFAQAIEETKKKFVEAMDDDFNTAVALASLFELGQVVYLYLEQEEKEPELLMKAQSLLLELSEVLGLAAPPSLKIGYTEKVTVTEYKGTDIEQNFPGLLHEVVDNLEAWKRAQLRDDKQAMRDAEDILKEKMRRILELREEARRQKVWQMADKIRTSLADTGIALEDRSAGTRWRLE